MLLRLLIAAPLLALATCSQPPGLPPGYDQPAPVSKADEPFRDVFRKLDGVWEGEFLIYQSKGGQQEGPSQPEVFDENLAERGGLELTGRVQVRQEYASESPFFQRVRIVDRVETGNGVEEIISTGVNKVVDGQLYCYVQKPKEAIAHEGTLEAPDTIVWRRSQTRPKQAIEFFREQVGETTYRIRGWGYYGDDDPDKAPHYWFAADYQRAPSGGGDTP